MPRALWERADVPSLGGCSGRDGSQPRCSSVLPSVSPGGLLCALFTYRHTCHSAQVGKAVISTLRLWLQAQQGRWRLAANSRHRDSTVLKAQNLLCFLPLPFSWGFWPRAQNTGPILRRPHQEIARSSLDSVSQALVPEKGPSAPLFFTIYVDVCLLTRKRKKHMSFETQVFP